MAAGLPHGFDYSGWKGLLVASAGKEPVARDCSLLNISSTAMVGLWIWDQSAATSMAAIVSITVSIRETRPEPPDSARGAAALPLGRRPMNALLIYPEFPDTFWSFKHALKFLGKRAAQPPLGLMTVAALLPRSLEEAAGRHQRGAAPRPRPGLGGRGSDKRHAHPARIARGHRRAVPCARVAHGGGRAHCQQHFRGRSEGGPRGHRRSREPDRRPGARAGARNGQARLSGR